MMNSFNGNRIVFEDMKSSGKINFIKSDNIRFSLLDYYNSSEREVKRQNESYLPEMARLRHEAFSDNIDMNSLVEKFLFTPGLQAEVDPLDLSFFEMDPNDPKVKHFANRVSLMKVSLRSNIYYGYELIVKATRLKNRITEYLSPNKVDGYNYIPKAKLTAIKEGDTDQLDILVPDDELTICFDTDFDTSNYLAISVYENSFTSLKYFVERGADIEQVCANKTPLMYAVKYGAMDMTKYLIEQGADINVVSIKDKTALDYAIQYERDDIAAYLKGLNAKQVQSLKPWSKYSAT